MNYNLQKSFSGLKYKPRYYRINNIINNCPRITTVAVEQMLQTEL